MKIQYHHHALLSRVESEVLLKKFKREGLTQILSYFYNSSSLTEEKDEQYHKSLMTTDFSLCPALTTLLIKYEGA